jgi:DNA invertase Pin-like site-specific DNA recombinase
VIRGYERVSTDGQSVDAQVKQLRAAAREGRLLAAVFAEDGELPARPAH